MRLAAAALLAFATIAAPAAADTVAHRTPAVGPAFAGERVAWGEETRAGGLRIAAGSVRRRPSALYRLAPSTARRTERGFFHTPWSLSASPTHIAAIVLTNTITSSGSDYVGTSSKPAAVGGPLGAPRVLSGAVTRRGDAPCEGTAYESPDAVAVDGNRIAVVENYGACGGQIEAKGRIAIVDGQSRRTLELGDGFSVVKLRLAGRYVGWVLEEGRRHGLVVHDLEAGVDVLRLARRSIDDFDLDAAGTVALTYADGPREVRLGLARAGLPGLRVLDRGVAGRGVAVAGGRVLYERLGREFFHSRLLLRSLEGGTRRLARFVPTRRRIGDLDLTPARAAWAAEPTRPGHDGAPRGPARIVARRL